MADWQTVELSPQETEKTKEDEFEIEVDLGENKDDNSEQSGEIVETSDEEQKNEEKETPEKTQSNDNPQKEKNVGKTRAKRTIERLKKENQELENKLNSANSEFEKRLEALEEGTNTSKVETQIANLESTATRLQSDIATAYKNEDYEKAVALQGQLSDTQVDIKVLKASQKTPSKEPRQSSDNTNANNRQQETLPEAFEDWLDENPWFNEPETRDERRLARYIKRQGQKLTQEEGYGADDDDLYEELQDMADKYVNEKKLKVEGFEIKEEPVKKEKRTPTTETKRDSGVSKVGNKIKVRLTDDERRIAKRFGMSEQEYAKQKILEQEKTKTGWSSVFGE